MKALLRQCLRTAHAAGPTRRLALAAWRRAVERIQWDAVLRDPQTALRLYRAHLAALEPLFSGRLAPEDPARPLAEAADQAFLDGFQRALDLLPDLAAARRINRELLLFERSRRLTRLVGRPVRMYLELTDVCNLKCPMCTQTIFRSDKRHLALETVEALRPAFRYIEELTFAGCGETFVHPHFREIIAAVPCERLSARIITNGLLLDESASRFLIERQIDRLSVSLDTPDAETFRHIRATPHHARIVENIRTLQRLKTQMGSERPHLTLNFAARRCNIEQLPDFVRLAAQLGAGRVQLGYLIVYRRDLIPESLFFHKELSDRCVTEARRVAGELGVELLAPPLFSDPAPAASCASRYESEKCIEVYEFVYVRGEGTLSPCCVNDTRLGTVAGRTFSELWNSPVYRDFRRRVNTPEEDLHCRHCMLAERDHLDIRHHLKLMDDQMRVEDVDYEALAAQMAAGPS